MADEADLTRLDEILSRVTALQEKQALLSETQSQRFELLTVSVKEITIDLQKFDAKVDEGITNNPHAAAANAPSFPWSVPQVGIATGSVQHTHFRSSQLTVSRFFGDNPSAWISQIQRYFDFYNIPDHRRSTIASYYLYGNALDWYEWMYKNHLPQSWSELLLAIANRFGPETRENSFGKSNESIQIGAVAAHHHMFDQLSNPVIGVPAQSFKVDSKTTTQEEIQQEIMVDMSCGGYVKSIKTTFETIEVATNNDTDFTNQAVQVLSTSPVRISVEALGQTEHATLLMGQGTSGDFFVSAFVVEFKGPTLVPIFSLSAAPIAHQPMLTHLAFPNCQQIHKNDRHISLKYWFSGTGCRWKMCPV